MCACTWSIIKGLICLWMVHPTYRGALFIQSIGQPFIEKYFGLISKHANKILGFVGIPSRVEEEKQSKSQ